MIKLELQARRVITAGALALGIGILVMGNGVSAVSKPITINQIKNTSVGAAGTVKGAKKKIVKIKIAGKTYTGKTNKKGKYYVKIGKKPSVGAKGTIKCNGKTKKFTVTKDTTLKVTGVSKQIKKGWFIKTMKNGAIKGYGPNYGITQQYDRMDGTAAGSKVFYTVSGIKGTKTAAVKSGKFTVKRTFQNWLPNGDSVKYSKMDRARRKINIYICAGKNKNQRLYHIAQNTAGKDKHDEVIYKAGIDYAWIIKQFTKEVNSGKWLEWKGVKAYMCNNSLMQNFGVRMSEQQKQSINNPGDNAAQNWLFKITGSYSVGYNDNATPTAYQVTERSYLYNNENGLLQKDGMTDTGMTGYMLVYKGYYNYGSTYGGDNSKTNVFTYYFAR